MRRIPSAARWRWPLDFSNPDGLCRSMQRAGVFYNTYWVRHARGRVTFDLAVENTRTLLQAAERAGVGRIVHFSVTDASSGSGLPYFRGKAQVEDKLVDLGIPYAIIRPTLVFGVGDLLLNMARALRRFPVFPVYGNGDYPVQPVYVEDVAAQAVEAGSQSKSSIADAAGPDTFSFEALLRLLASSMGVRKQVPAHAPFGGSRFDRTGQPADARYGAHPRRGWLIGSTTTRRAWVAGTCPRYGATTDGRLGDSAALFQEWAIDCVPGQERLQSITPEASIARLFENTPIT